MAEAMIAAGQRGWGRQMQALFEQINFEIVPVTAATARRIGEIYARWGKSAHPARLNFGDCFAYDTNRRIF